MQTIVKRVLRLRVLLIILGLSTFIICSETNKASAEVQKKDSYLIKINRVYNTITIYEQDEEGEYTVPIKAMLCSVGAKGQTKTGTFQTKAKYRWKLLMGDVWGQYSTRIVGGILFHSVYYYGTRNPATLATNEFNKLGTAASHGCVRLAVKDAKWIYDNCALGTTVTIYDDKKSPGPLGKPEAIKISSNVRWDPTDPDENNPYKDKQPVITGAKNISITLGEKYDLLKGIKAKSSLGTDITSKVTVQTKVNMELPGKYKVTYSVTDDLGKTTTKIIVITIKDNEVAPELVGISDRVVKAGIPIDEEFALSGVEAYRNGIKLDKSAIKVKIEKINEQEYYITYQASVGKSEVATGNSKVVIDGIAPVFTGITDKTLEAGEVPATAYLMEKVYVSDNYTATKDIKLTISFIENADGTYLVTYEAVDEAGNKTVEHSVINN